MSTWGQMAERVLLNLGGYVEDQEAVTTVATGGCNSTDTSIPVASVDGFSRGLIEIGDELVWVGKAITATSTLTECVRGWRGSTAVAHTAGEIVRDNPRYPRFAALQAMTDTLRSVYPRLFGIAQTDIASTIAVGYELPAACERVLRVEVRAPGEGVWWTPLPAWGFVGKADTVDFPTGKAINLDVSPGREVKVTYATRPTVPTSGQEFTVSGLSASAEDVIVLGACARMANMSAAGQASNVSAEAQLIDSRSAIQTFQASARLWFAQYQQRLEEEAQALLADNPTRAHRRI